MLSGESIATSALPLSVGGIFPRPTWAKNGIYDSAPRSITDDFRRNFMQFAVDVDESICAATLPGMFGA
jgi:hypothetical protein